MNVKKIIAVLFLMLIFIPQVSLASCAGDCRFEADYNACMAACEKSEGNNGNKNGGNGSSSSTTFPNPLTVESVQAVIEKALVNLQGILGAVAVLFIVIGGILYITSGGNEKRITLAKACITAAVIGLAIALAGPSFLKEISTILGADESSSAISDAPSLLSIITNILTLLLSILGIIGIISLVTGGIMYLTAYGDEKKAETAKKMITYSIIGITVALAAVIIVQQVDSLISG
ncbi:MAG TPA: pilin [Candidatus Moranbacteria bacterium]|nr:pilin [Candidatus Moranbacteria bacterium]